MSDSNKNFENTDNIKETSRYYHYKRPFKKLNFFIKDIDISKRDFLLIFLMINSLVFLLLFQIGIIGNMEQMLENRQMHDIRTYSIIAIAIGIFFGFLLSSQIVDLIKKPLPVIKYILVFSLVINLIQVPLFYFEIYPILSLLFAINFFIIIIALMITIKIFLIKTTILERGRVLAFLFVLTFICIAIILGTIFFEFLLLIPIIFVFFTIVFIYKFKGKYNITFPKSKDDKEVKFHADLIKYYLFYLCFSLTAGFALSVHGSSQFVSDTVKGYTAFLFLIVLVSLILVSILMGVVFDFFGRIIPLTYIILAIALATYIQLFTVRNFSLPVIFTAYIASVMIVPIFVGDTITRKNFGKTLSISYLIIIIGIAVGIGLRFIIPTKEIAAESFIVSSIFIGCIFCLLFLIFIRETLPRKEQAWKSFLYQIYIINDSGLLLYEKSFKDEEKIDNRSVPSDLKAGGIIGVKTILKEIIQGKELTHIDYGDRILLINHSNKNVFALVVKEELIVLMRKLEALIEDFNKDYLVFTNEIGRTGVDMNLFKPVKHLVDKHFGS